MKSEFLDRIRANIEASGRHITSVLGGESPRFLYTIGLTLSVGKELLLAGFAHMPVSAAGRLLNSLSDELVAGVKAEDLTFEFENFGCFHLAQVDSSWGGRTLLGVMDLYDLKEARCLQVLPEEPNRTIDIPDMSLPFAPPIHQVWKWLDGGWPYSVGADSTVVTNLDALLGHAISELVRWEANHWEMFSGPGPDVPKEEMFEVPLATLLAFDPSLEAALDLDIGSGLYREFDATGQAGVWQSWVRKS